MAERFALDRVLLTPEEAIGLLPAGEMVHVVIDHGPCKLGACWTRESVQAVIRSSKMIEIGGPRCRAGWHGLVVWDVRRQLFVEHREGVDWEALEAGASGPEIV